MSVTDEHWQLYICRACGLIYDEREGDPDSGLAPGTRFEDIPEDWECPLCGVTKSDFELFERPIIDESAQLAMQHKKGVIIIGAGIAGWAMAESIRRINSILPITLITACEGDIYHKPELSVAIARGQQASDLIREHAPAAAQRLGVNLLPKTFVIGICAITKSVRTTRGTFEYEHVVLAQGAKAYQPDQIPAEWCWRVNHLATWKELQQRLSQGSQRIAIVGGGLVGCELAENLCRAGHHVNFIYRSPTLLPSLLPTEAGTRLQTLLKQQGVLCWDTTDVQTVQRANRIYSLRLSSGKVIEVDHIVTATGLVTDDRLARKAGLEFNNGISVDAETLASSQPDIFALGDCISLEGSPCRFIAPINTQAQVIAEQIVAPLNPPKQPNLYRHQPPTIRVKVQACSLVLRGQPALQGQWQTVHDDEHQLTMEQYSDGRLVSRLEFAIAS